ncbi:hypothetical protein LaP1706_gp57 [Lactococcus phage 1706]|uniref:Uncharacterized protein n=1 Tax=Lactococcus phage 1706 TaxID=475178 RepID=B2BTM1_9CAUD|nr:hypothetical protein LaP1706_gp57 [Lactococcus phage 1706]ABV91264.1 unknown [Lactococcus phage 1706]
MKNIKNTLKGIKADFVAFTKDKEKVKGVITTATLIGLGAVAMNEHNKRTFKKKTERIQDHAFGAGVHVGVANTLTDVVNNRDIETMQANKAYDRIDEHMKITFEDNKAALDGYNLMQRED